RIAMYLSNNTFTGTVTCRSGNSGSGLGGAGTVYTKVDGEPHGLLRIDNLALRGAQTPVDVPMPVRLMVGSGALVYPAEGNLFQSIMIQSGGAISHWPGTGKIDILVNGDVEIESGGFITADGRGHPAMSGPGRP